MVLRTGVRFPSSPPEKNNILRHSCLGILLFKNNGLLQGYALLFYLNAQKMRQNLLRAQKMRICLYKNAQNLIMKS
jgi:hypothetical protein